MAVSTINDKLALISYHQPFNTPIPISADGLGQADNQHLIWEYPGVLFTSAVPANVAAAFMMTRHSTGA